MKNQITSVKKIRNVKYIIKLSNYKKKRKLNKKNTIKNVFSMMKLLHKL
jgi:hypothetical protein